MTHVPAALRYVVSVYVYVYVVYILCNSSNKSSSFFRVMVLLSFYIISLSVVWLFILVQLHFAQLHSTLHTLHSIFIVPPTLHYSYIR